MGRIASLSVDSSEVGELHIEVALCCPTAAVVIFLQTELVHPDLSRLGLSRLVAHSDNHGLYLSKRRIAHNGHPVVGVVLVINGESTVVGRQSQSLSLVAFLFYRGEYACRNVKHILAWPHQPAVLDVVLVVSVGCSQFQRYLVFVVVTLVVRAQTDEYCQLVVL